MSDVSDDHRRRLIFAGDESFDFCCYGGAGLGATTALSQRLSVAMRGRGSDGNKRISGRRLEKSPEIFHISGFFSLQSAQHIPSDLRVGQRASYVYSERTRFALSNT